MQNNNQHPAHNLKCGGFTASTEANRKPVKRIESKVSKTPLTKFKTFSTGKKTILKFYLAGLAFSLIMIILNIPGLLSISNDFYFYFAILGAISFTGSTYLIWIDEEDPFTEI